IENQSYITIRFIIVRVLGLISIFLLIKNSESYYIYAGILVLMSSGSNIFNLINLRKYVEFSKIEKIDLRKHFKPILTIFTASLAVSIYLQLDSVMIGSIAGVNYVAYYSVANKLIRLVLVLVTALGTVMIPRLSNCLKTGDKERYKNYANISLKYILFISIPSFTGIVLLAKEIIYIMAGEKFIESILTMQIVSIIIVIVGIAYFIGFQILYPYNLEKYYTYSVTVAAIINFIFNYTFIPKYYQNGAAFGTVLAELTGVLIMLYFAKDKLKEIEFYHKSNLKYIIASLLMGLFILILKKLNLSSVETLTVSIVLGGLFYLTLLFFLKEYFVVEGIKILKTKMKRS
ncbi:MAG: polysaccharide biosynthesis C-terminal domain-containing protein, partial [Cetobacterium sp.]